MYILTFLIIDLGRQPANYAAYHPSALSVLKNGILLNEVTVQRQPCMFRTADLSGKKTTRFEKMTCQIPQTNHWNLCVPRRGHTA